MFSKAFIRLKKSSLMIFCGVCFISTMFFVSNVSADTSSSAKLGSIHSVSSSTKCQEGHAGAAFGGCAKVVDKKCTSTSCPVGMICSSVTDKCEFQECSGTTDKSCSDKYDHFHSCVYTQNGTYQCMMTCNWTKLNEKGYNLLNNGSVNIVVRMQTEKALWEGNLSSASKFNQKVGSDYVFPEANYYSNAIDTEWYTCKNGKPEKCYKYPVTKNNSTTFSSRTDEVCLPCTFMMGYDYGLTGKEELTNTIKNTYAYAVGPSSTSLDSEDTIYTGRNRRYVNSTGVFWARTFIRGCAKKQALTSSSLTTRLKNVIPFITVVNTGYRTYTPSGVTGMRWLGNSEYCTQFNLTSYYKFRLMSNCDDHSKCIYSTDVSDLVYIPKQSKTIYLFTSGSYDTTTANYNAGINVGSDHVTTTSLNYSAGNLFCCKVGPSDKASSFNGSSAAKPWPCIRVE